MRALIAAASSLLLAAALSAQTPPTNAKDISEMPGQASQTAPGAAAPSANISAPASVVRIYVANLNGADANALAGLITQSLFQSKQVVVTTNASNASLTLQGSVTRQPIEEEAHRSTTRSRRPARSSASGTGNRAGSASPFGDNARVTELPPLGGSSDSGSMAAAAPGAPLLSGDLNLPLSGLGDMNASADLSHYRYRLNLELVNPGGDLVWMSGQGRQALPYQDADDAVVRTLAPMLALVRQMSTENATSSASPAVIPHE